jgi:hypothetical protein
VLSLEVGPHVLKKERKCESKTGSTQPEVKSRYLLSDFIVREESGGSASSKSKSKDDLGEHVSTDTRRNEENEVNMFQVRNRTTQVLEQAETNLQDYFLVVRKDLWRTEEMWKSLHQ